MPQRRAVTGLSREPRKRFAEELRRQRLARGESLRDLADVMGWEYSLFSKMECGMTLGGPEVVQALDDHYGTRGLLLTLWELAGAEVTQFRERYRQYMLLEAEARYIQMYSHGLMSGLLQTEAYAREVLLLGGLSEGEELDQQVAARVSRQDVLNGPEAPQFRAILDETVLRRTLPDPSEWRHQLEHLLKVAQNPRVTIQVLPFSAGMREMGNTDVVFLRQADGTTVAWVETGYDGQLIRTPADVERLQCRFEQLRDHALSPRRSIKFIKEVLEEIRCVPPEQQ